MSPGVNTRLGFRAWCYCLVYRFTVFYSQMLWCRPGVGRISGSTVPSPRLDHRGGLDDGDLRTDSGPRVGLGFRVWAGKGLGLRV